MAFAVRASLAAGRGTLSPTRNAAASPMRSARVSSRCQTEEHLCVDARHLNTVANNSMDALVALKAMPQCGRRWSVYAEAPSQTVQTPTEK